MSNSKEPRAIAGRQRAKRVQEKELWGHKFKLVDKGFDPAEICCFLGTLIEENNTLLKKLQHIDSLMELAENAVAEAKREADCIKQEVEERARAESDKIISEARLEAERTAQDKLVETRREAEEIKAQAEEEANGLLTVANQKADEMVSQRMASAEREAQEVVRQKKEQFKTIYQKLLSSLDSIDLSDISAKLSMEDILCTPEEGAEPAAPQKARTLNVNIPLKVLPGFLRQRINKPQPPSPE